MIFGVFDNETTGLTKHFQADLKKQPRVIEFAGLLTDGVDIIDTVEFICNPGEEIEEIITRITGLTNEQLKQHPSYAEQADIVADFFARADAVIAHNLSFDKRMTETEAEHMDSSLFGFMWPRIECCTVEATFPQFGRRMKLSELYERAVGPYEQKHRALDDVKLLHEVCKHYGIYDALTRAYA